jgi:hypothetical protein
VPARVSSTRSGASRVRRSILETYDLSIRSDAQFGDRGELAGLDQLLPAIGTRRRVHERAQRLLSPRDRRSIGRDVYGLPATVSTKRERHPDGQGLRIICSHHAALLVIGSAGRNSVVNWLKPSIRSRISTQSTPRSTRSTRNWTMRACSAGNSSSRVARAFRVLCGHHSRASLRSRVNGAQSRPGSKASRSKRRWSISGAASGTRGRSLFRAKSLDQLT